MLGTTFTVPISNNSIKILPLAVQRRKEGRERERVRERESQVSMRANPICFLFTLTLLLPLGLAQPTSTAPDLSPALLPSPAPPPTAGGDFSSSPSRGWGGWASSSPSSHSPAPETPPPLVPREGTPSALTPAGAPEGGEGIPFLSSNPAVPLPTGMTDTATYRPLPTPGDGTQAVGLASPTVAVGWRLAVVFAMMMCCSDLGPWM